MRNDDGKQVFASMVQANIVKGGARNSDAPLSKARAAQKLQPEANSGVGHSQSKFWFSFILLVSKQGMVVVFRKTTCAMQPSRRHLFNGEIRSPCGK